MLNCKGMITMYEWVPTDEQVAFLRRTIRHGNVGFMWEVDFNPTFVDYCIGVQDYRQPHGQRPDEINVYPIHSPNFNGGRDGRLFCVGSFKPEAHDEIRRILQEHGYESMDRVVIA